jgi:hypothetical protein
MLYSNFCATGPSKYYLNLTVYIGFKGYEALNHM